MAQKSDIIYGIHACHAALRVQKRRSYRLLIRQGTAESSANLVEVAKQNKTPVVQIPAQEFDGLLPSGAVHQGVALEVEPFKYTSFSELIKRIHDPCLLVVLDQISDPHNFGAILRSACAFGAQGIIVVKDQACPVTATVAKAASGALETIAISQVTNLARCLEDLKKVGFWCYGLAEGGESLTDVSFPDRTVLVIGAEGKGLRVLTQKTCDALVSIPTQESFTTLNASNAAAVACYHWRLRCSQ